MRIILLTLLVCFHVIGWGQGIGGVVNKYFKVTTTYTDWLSMTVESANGLNAGDTVMVIQMKGATVSTNNSSYGNIASLGNAGNYEIAKICHIEGNRVFFVHKLAKTYNEAGKLQLVRIPRYTSVTVSSKLEAAPWDNTKGTGGVLAISVDGTLTLNADISADGKGLKGGAFVISGGYCKDDVYKEYSYDPALVSVTDYTVWPINHDNVQKGAAKGESIHDMTASISGGRGKIANGGGGGNNHNTGGGGGSNFGAGGSAGKNTTFEGGSCSSDYQGLGGTALDTSKKKLFLGGGGGSGHGNNTAQTGGGAGGGIVYIMAETLVDNGKSISANGQDGSSTMGDGASGGGGGGSIVLSIDNYDGIINVSAKGGNGGNVDNEDFGQRCFGEGGGGGGGTIYFKGSIPTGVQVQGGLKGQRILSKGCTTASIAADGGNGAVTANYSYERSMVISSECRETSYLPVTLISFKAIHKGPQVLTEWEVAQPEDAAHYILQRRDGNNNWRDVHVIPADERATNYRKSDGPLAIGIYLYRLKIVEKDRSVTYSTVQQVTIKAEDVNRLMIHPNPATSEITIITPVQNEEWMNIYDMKSRLVHRKKVMPNNPAIKQDISFLSEGVYMIQVGKYTARFVVFK